VVLIPQVTTDYLGDDDRIVERRIAGYCGSSPLRIDERVDFRDLKGLYSACDLMLGTRFHSVIFALTSMVPCLAIEYEHKTRGIMRDLGLEEWVLPIDEVSHARLWSSGCVPNARSTARCWPSGCPVTSDGPRSSRRNSAG
jgi:colanic acid/amylovoran biosynthesis protein